MALHHLELDGCALLNRDTATIWLAVCLSQRNIGWRSRGVGIDSAGATCRGNRAGCCCRRCRPGIWSRACLCAH